MRDMRFLQQIKELLGQYKFFESCIVHQLRNSRHRSVSGFAENCAVVGISSLSAADHFVGFAAELGRGDPGVGSGSFVGDGWV